jgi:hypothetical protein
LLDCLCQLCQLPKTAHRWNMAQGGAPTAPTSLGGVGDRARTDWTTENGENPPATTTRLPEVSRNSTQSPPKERPFMKTKIQNPIPTVLSFGNTAMRCTACAKHSKQQCKNPAVTGYKVCRVHGARGGPKTQEGIDRIAAANTVHGRETRAKRLTRQVLRARLEMAIALGHNLGMFGSKHQKKLIM